MQHEAIRRRGRSTRGRSAAVAAQAPKPDPSKFLTQPLVRDIYTADPSAHVFNGKIFIYPSHDIDAGVPPDDLGSHFAMRDYHVFSMDAVGGKVTDHGVALDIKNVPWAGRQMWAPDAAEKDGKLLLVLSGEGQTGRVSHRRGGRRQPGRSVHGAARADQGQLQHRPCGLQGQRRQVLHVLRRYLGRTAAAMGERRPTKPRTSIRPKDQPALSAKVARLGDDMVSFAEAPKDVVLLDEKRQAAAGRRQRPPLLRSGLAAQVQRHVLLLLLDGRHALHHVCDRHVALRAVYGAGARFWSRCSAGRTTTRSSSSRASGISSITTPRLSGGQTHLRNIKVTELKYRADGSIVTVDAYIE